MRFPLFVCPIQVVAIVVLHVFCLLRLQSFQSSQDQIDTSRWSIGRLSLHQIEMIRASATFCSGPAPMSHTTLEGEVRQHDFFRGGQHSSNSSSRPSGSAAPCLPLTVTLGQTRQVAMSDIAPPHQRPPYRVVRHRGSGWFLSKHTQQAMACSAFRALRSFQP